MALAFLFVAICIAAALFMIRFLIAICGRDGQPARLGYALQIQPEPGGGDGGNAGWDRLRTSHSHLPVPLTPVLPFAGSLQKGARPVHASRAQSRGASGGSL